MSNPRQGGRPRDRRAGARLKLSTYAYRDKRRRGEGLRLGCARYPVRGVRKSRYAAEDIMDVWLPTVAPSRELLAGPAATTWKTRRSGPPSCGVTAAR
jgi:hypothetical protein